MHLSLCLMVTFALFTLLFVDYLKWVLSRPSKLYYPVFSLPGLAPTRLWELYIFLCIEITDMFRYSNWDLESLCLSVELKTELPRAFVEETSPTCQVKSDPKLHFQSCGHMCRDNFSLHANPRILFEKWLVWQVQVHSRTFLVQVCQYHLSMGRSAFTYLGTY